MSFHIAYPEFKNALRNLGAKHPNAYQDFVHDLQPDSDRRVSRVTVHQAPPSAMATRSPGHGASEDSIMPRNATDTEAAPATTQPPENKSQVAENRRKYIDELIQLLPTGDVNLSRNETVDGSGRVIPGITGGRWDSSSESEANGWSSVTDISSLDNQPTRQVSVACQPAFKLVWTVEHCIHRAVLVIFSVYSSHYSIISVLPLTRLP